MEIKVDNNELKTQNEKLQSNGKNQEQEKGKLETQTRISMRKIIIKSLSTDRETG